VPVGVVAGAASAKKTRSKWFKDVTVKAHDSAMAGARKLRQRITMVLALRDLDDMLDEDGKPTDAEDRE